MYILYMLMCIDNSLYTGITSNLDRRIRQHNGEIIGGAKYTCMRRPVKLIYSMEFKNRSEASKKEYEIKKMTRVKKLELISKFNKE